MVTSQQAAPATEDSSLDTRRPQDSSGIGFEYHNDERADMACKDDATAEVDGSSQLSSVQPQWRHWREPSPEPVIRSKARMLTEQLALGAIETIG